MATIIGYAVPKKNSKENAKKETDVKPVDKTASKKNGK